MKGIQSWHNTDGLGKNIDFKKRGSSISKALTGLKRTDKYKEARSKLMKEKWADPEYRKKQSGAMKGKKAWNKGLKMPEISGENSPNWKGGITSQQRKERNNFNSLIRPKIFERDDYTCQMCGKRGVFLHVDHIKSWSDYPELRFKKDNCRTLCQSCHYKITFGNEMPKAVTTWGQNLTQLGG